MAKTVRFNLEMIADGCEPACVRARKLFSPNRDYSLREIMLSGVLVNDIMWLLYTRAEKDAATFRVLENWVNQCRASVELPSIKARTVEDLQAGRKEAVRVMAIRVKSLKGAKNWALFNLCDVALKEGKKS